MKQALATLLIIISIGTDSVMPPRPTTISTSTTTTTETL